MNGKAAKHLRRLITSNSQLDLSYDDLLTNTGTSTPLKWNRGCQRGAYRQLKTNLKKGLVS